MSGFSGLDTTTLGPILQITGSGGTVITNPYGPVTDVYSVPGGAGACATYVAAGNLEVATNAESLAGTYLGGSGCPLALSPVNQSFRPEVATGAMMTPFTATTPIVAGFGAYALDISPNRTLAANIASGAGSICLGVDNRATYGNGIAIGVNNQARGTRAVTLGSTNTNYGDNGLALGYRNACATLFGGYDGCTAVGRSNSAYSPCSVALGVLNNAYAPANLNSTTGAIAGDPQAFINSGINSTAVGQANQVSDLRGQAFGHKNILGYGGAANYYGSVGVGLYNTVYGGTNYPNIAVGANNQSFAESVLFGYANYSSGFYGTAIGWSSGVYGFTGVALGYRCYSGAPYSATGGRSCFVANTAYSAAAFGVMNNVYTPGNLDNTTGVIAGDPQAVATYTGINSSAFGVGNLAENLRSNAFGFKSRAANTGATAIGDRAVARIQDTTNIAGPIIIRQDNGEGLAEAFRAFAGAEVIIFTDEIDLESVADHTITLPANCHFRLDSVGIELTELTGIITSQPTVRFGINGTPAKYIAANVTTLLTAVGKREVYETLLQDDSETSLLFGVTVGAVVGTSMSGRAYFRGILLEDE